MADARPAVATTRSLALMWTLQAQFAGYVLAHEELTDLELVPRQPDRSPMLELLEGRADYAVAAPSHLLAAPPEGPPLVLVALFMARSPVRLVGLSDRVGPILEPAPGLRIGVWRGEDLEIRAMLRLAGAELAEVQFISVSDELAALAAGEVDYVQATTYNELPAIAAAVGGHEHVVIHDPADWNVDAPKDGVAVRAEMLGEDPDGVVRVIRAMIGGWHTAIADPERALAAVLHAAPALDPRQQQLQLAEVLALFEAGHPIGEPRTADVERARHAARVAGDPRADARVAIAAEAWQQASD